MFLLNIAVQVICGAAVVVLWNVSIAEIGAIKWIIGWMIIASAMPEIRKVFRT